MCSMNEKIVIAFDTACKLCDNIDEGNLSVDGEMADLIYGHADGLFAKRLYDLRDGRCSIAASIAFDFDKEMEKLDRDIEIMNGMLGE